MLFRRHLRLMILVKAAPVLTRSLEETMCVAAADLEEPQWIRLHPVPFRDLEDDNKFRKYQEVEVEAFRSSKDRRPESWTPLEGTLRPGRIVGTAHAWSDRRSRVDALDEVTMCDLIEANATGSGPGTPSLGVVRPAEPPKLQITRRDAATVADWKRRATAIAAAPSLFDDPTQPKRPLEVLDWRFRYLYRCRSPHCNGHRQTIVDWEAVALFRNVRRFPDWQERMRSKFQDEMWAGDRDSLLFVGNMEQHPQSFLVLGVFWPPSKPMQGALAPLTEVPALTVDVSDRLLTPASLRRTASTQASPD